MSISSLDLDAGLAHDGKPPPPTDDPVAASSAMPSASQHAGWGKPVKLKQEKYRFDGVDYQICTLLDRNQYDDNDFESRQMGISSATWPLFGQVWPAAQVLVKHVIAEILGGRRILEIGCGIGLASIVLHRMGADITASDYHPQTLPFLQRNLLQNALSPIKFERGNWDTDNPELGEFDLIIGSDVLYQPAHAEQVSRFISRHSSNDVDVIIIDPGREVRPRFTRAMRALGYDYRFEKFDEPVQGNQRCHGWILHYHRQFSID